MSIRDLYTKVRYFRRWRVFKTVESYTMVSHERLHELCDTLTLLDKEGVAGAVVECGSWKGGAAAVMGWMVSHSLLPRDLWIFDSFAGLPEPTDADGEKARAQYARDTGVASPEEVRAILQRVGVPEGRTHIVGGWFNETLSAQKESIGPIALLHLDCDWYESTTTCLEELYDRLVPGGYLICDDYRTWEGSKRALTEFLAARGLVDALVIRASGTASLKKPEDATEDAYWSVESQKYQKPHERLGRIAAEIPGGSVLDIGCGPGALGTLLQKKGVTYAGVDVFAQTLPYGRYAVFDLAKDPFSRFPFAETFDRVVVSGVLEYLPLSRIQELLPFICETLLRKDGTAIITYTNFSHYAQARGQFHPRWITRVGINDMRRLLEDSGFRVVRAYPSYYLLLGRRIRTKSVSWIPFFSRYFGRQIVFVLAPRPL